MNSLYRLLNKYGKVRGDELMSKHTSINTGGSANYLIFIDNRKGLIKLLTELDSSGIDYFVLGSGYNTLVSESGFDGVVVKNETNEMKVKDSKLHVDSGADITKVAKHSMSSNLAGFEIGIGAVGSIGGNIVGNEKIKNKRLSLLIDKIKGYKDGEEVVYNNEDCEFGCDRSFFERSGVVITKVVFDLKEGGSSAKKSMEYIKYKSNSLPATKSSIGPIFKHMDSSKFDLDNFDKSKIEKQKEINPKILLEQIDINKENGQVRLYDKNPNFVINEGNASSDNVLQFIEKMEHTVYDTYGIELERKMSTVGF